MKTKIKTGTDRIPNSHLQPSVGMIAMAIPAVKHDPTAQKNWKQINFEFLSLIVPTISVIEDWDSWKIENLRLSIPLCYTNIKATFFTKCDGKLIQNCNVSMVMSRKWENLSNAPGGKDMNFLFDNRLCNRWVQSIFAVRCEKFSKVYRSVKSIAQTF